ncbi:protein of unknown function [Candidatus Nitrospira inopinata]|uniref:Uncharacterized protein n=1 Tax=Candidatus Nitrospira inopinata TaxID=1715989 RepID=A0A0S4KXR5_9BACT|nr:protein of unknown function [Candidatus Nitrospira inopinata]
MMRASNVVSASLPGCSSKPGASSCTSQGAANIPRIVTSVTTVRSVVKTALASSHTSCLPRVVRYSVKTGMKAEDMDPSANSSRSRLGTRNATKKASAAGVAPNNRASTMSRMKPRIRLAKVPTPITPAAFTTDWCSSCFDDGETTEAVGCDMVRILAEHRETVYRPTIFLARERRGLRLLDQLIRQFIGIVTRPAGAHLR